MRNKQIATISAIAAVIFWVVCLMMIGGPHMQLAGFFGGAALGATFGAVLFFLFSRGE